MQRALDGKRVFAHYNIMGPKPLTPTSQSQTARASAALKYLAANRGRPQYRHAPHAGSATRKIISPLSKKFGPGTFDLRSQWAEIVGEKWASLSRPEKITGGKNGRTIVVTAKGPAAALLQAQSRQILAKINHYRGGAPLAHIRVISGMIAAETTPARDLHLSSQETSEADSENKTELQAALDRLGTKIAKSAKGRTC